MGSKGEHIKKVKTKLRSHCGIMKSLGGVLEYFQEMS